MGDVFISYSRKDTEFVHNLDTALTEHSHNVWVDWKEIRGGSEWWEEIIAGIEGADKFIFVISPDSIDSEYCGKEIEYAVSQNKKILPILWRSGLGSKGIPLRSEVSSHHYISFEARDDFDQAIQELNEAINLDIDLFHAHKRLLVKAIEWGNGRSDSLLLRRDDLANAEQWLAASVSQAPKPTELQETYIKNSRVVEDASDQAKAILEKAAADAQITATVAENARKESEKKAADAQRAATDAENARKESEKKAADAQSAATGAENALKEAKKKTDLQIKIGSGILAGTILLAVVAGVSATKFVNEANVKVDETERDANEKKKIADLAVRSAQKKADDIKKVSEKDARDAEQKVNGANAKKKDAEMKVEEAQKNLESAKAEAEKVSKESQEQVAAAQAKIADALTRVKSSQLELKILNDGLNVAKLINSQSPQNGDLVRAVLLSIESVIDSRSIQSKQIKDQAIKTLTETLEQSREINIFRGQDEKPVYFVAPTSDRDMNIFAIVYNKPKKLLEFQVWDANGSVISSNSKPLGIATYLGKLVVSTFTRNNKAILIIGDSKGIIKLQDIQDNYILGLKPSGTTSSATSIATSKDGSVIAAAYGDPYIRIWRSDIWITNQQDKFSENISFLDEEDLKVNPMCSVNLVAIDSKGETIVSVIKQVQEGEILKSLIKVMQNMTNRMTFWLKL